MQPSRLLHAQDIRAELTATRVAYLALQAAVRHELTTAHAFVAAVTSGITAHVADVAERAVVATNDVAQLRSENAALAAKVRTLEADNAELLAARDEAIAEVDDTSARLAASVGAGEALRADLAAARDQSRHYQHEAERWAAAAATIAVGARAVATYAMDGARDLIGGVLTGPLAACEARLSRLDGAVSRQSQSLLAHRDRIALLQDLMMRVDETAAAILAANRDQLAEAILAADTRAAELCRQAAERRRLSSLLADGTATPLAGFKRRRMDEAATATGSPPMIAHDAGC